MAREAHESMRVMTLELVAERSALEASHAQKEDELIKMEGIIRELRTRVARGGGSDGGESGDDWSGGSFYRGGPDSGEHHRSSRGPVLNTRTSNRSAQIAAAVPGDGIMPMSEDGFDENVSGFQAYNVPEGMVVVLLPKAGLQGRVGEWQL